MPRQPFDIPHLALPIRVANGVYVTEQQGSLDCVTTAVQTICSFEIGSRIERPDFGIPDPTLKEMPVDTEAIEQAVATWEPDAMIEINQTPDPVTGMTRINITVSVPYSEDS
jgi:phage baseplate assembly protein W